MASYENRTFEQGKMDSDTSPDYLPNGFYKYGLNITPVNYETGNVGVVTNLPGNEKVNYDFPQLDSDAFIRVIGSVRDLKRRRVYWLIWAQNEPDDEYAYVLYYSYETGDITTVFSNENVLDFSKDGIIDNINIVYDDELGDTLFWTDTITEPKKLNVAAGVNRFNNYVDQTSGFELDDIVFADGNDGLANSRLFIPCICVSATDTYPEYNYTTGELNTTDFQTLPVGQCYPPFVLRSMFYQKSPSPYWSPNATYEYDTSDTGEAGVSSFLRRRSLQFAYAYVYFDGQISELSPFSEAVFSQELTSGVYTVGGNVADPDFPTPLSVKLRVPIHSYRYTDFDDMESVLEMPHAMIARVKLFIRDVPTTKTPTDWMEWEDIPYEDFYKYDASSQNISEGFPFSGDPGTYYYDWFNSSYRIAPSTQTSEKTTITVSYDGTQTLLPVDVKYASTNVYAAPKKSNTQTIIGNRMVQAGVTDGINVSRDVIESLEDNIRFFKSASNPDISNDSETTQINIYDNSPTSQTANSAAFTAVYDLQDVLVIGDFDNNISYSFVLNFLISGPTSAPVDIALSVSGTSNGIPGDSADFNDFIQDIFSDYIGFNTLGAFGFSASANNTTGEATFQLLIPSGYGSYVGLSGITENDGFTTTETYLPLRTFKNHSTQQFGFSFRDALGRQTPVITGDWATLEFPHFITEFFEPQTFLAQINGFDDISVPSDVRVIDILRKRSQSYNNYIQFPLSSGNCEQINWNLDPDYIVGYLNLDLDEPSPESATNNKNVYISLNSINGGDGRSYESEFNTSILDFLPSAGDVLRFLYRLDDDGDFVEIYNASFNIDRYDERTNTIVLDFSDISQNEPELADYLDERPSNRVNSRIFCEVIQKTTTSDQEFYWETAAQLSCTDGSVDRNSFTDVLFLYGDAYLKLRGSCINYNGTNASGDVFENFILQDPNYNDFFPSNNVGEGRPNIRVRSLRRGQDEYVETTRDNLIRYSEQSIQNTDVKRYGTFYDENIQEVDNIFGRIEKINGDGDKLDIYQEDKMAMVYVGRSVTTELGGGQRVIASQNNVFSDVVYNNFNGGISQDSGSFAEAGYRKYLTDRKRGRVYRQSLDGITPISDVGMKGAFTELFRKVRNSYVEPVIRGIIDDRADEYILSVTYSQALECVVQERNGTTIVVSPPEEGSYFQVFAEGDIIQADTIPNGTGKYRPTENPSELNQQGGGDFSLTFKPAFGLPEPGDTIRVSYPVTEVLVFSEKTGGWTSYLSYDAEWLESGIQSYHTFVDGQMWIHDVGNTNYNTFHTFEFPSEIEVASNVEPQKVKEWRTLALKSKFSNFSVDEGDISTSLEQSSYIPNASFRLEEGHQKSVFYRDANESILEGSRLKGRWLTVKVTANDYEVNEEQLKIFSIMLHSIESPFSL